MEDVPTLTVERDGRNNESNYHAGSREYHNLTPAYNVNVLQREEGEDEVRARYDEPDGRWSVEANLLEECRCVSLSDWH